MTKKSAYEFETRTYGDISVVSLLPQRYLSDSQAAFIAALRQARTESNGDKVIVDLSRAVLVTSGPIGAMVAMHRQLARDGGRIVAAGGGDFATKVLKFAANILDHHPTVADALTALGASPAVVSAYEKEHGA